MGTKAKLPIAVGVASLVAALWFAVTPAQQRAKDGLMQAAPPGAKATVASWVPDQHSSPPVTRPGRRRVNRPKGQRIVDLLSASDTELEVDEGSSPPFAAGSGKPEEDLELLTRDASAVVLARVRTVTAGLTPAEDYVESQVDAEIEEVLKDPGGKYGLQAGQRFQFKVEGGVLNLGPRRIIAKKSWADLPGPGRRYIYFLAEDYWGHLGPYSDAYNFEVLANGLRRMRTDSAATVASENVDTALGLNVIRAAATAAPVK